MLFDKFWGSSNSLALTSMYDVYMPPVEYDNIKKMNIDYLADDKVQIEGNKKLKISGSSKDFDYIDTFKIQSPSNTFEFTNKIFIQFEDSKSVDSIYLVVSKSEVPDVFYHQIFLSSVTVKDLNKNRINIKDFRIDKSKLVSGPLLENNDTLINSALLYFNTNKDSLKLAECGTNSRVFESVCKKFNVPCRLLYLQGGDADVAGFGNQIGYPIHMLCEVYSSKFQEWYVIDPTYGFRFRIEDAEEFLSGVEICNKFFFSREKEIIQDSILFTKRTLVGRDYFKYYENVYFDTDFKPNYLLRKFMQHFYGSFNYKSYVYALNTPFLKNGKNYLIIKSLMYLFLVALLFNVTVFFLTKRLMLSKKPKEIKRI